MQKSKIEVLKAFIKEDPGDYFSRYALALEHAKEGSINEAIHLIEEILEENDNYIAGYYQLGKFYEEIGRIDHAKKTFEKGMMKSKGKDNRTYNELKSVWEQLNDE